MIRIWALVAFAVLALEAPGVAGAGMPDHYRYTGWMTPGGDAPKHAVFEGDLGLLEFADAFNLMRTPVRYQVCVRAAQSGRKRFCTTGTAPLDTRPSVIQLPNICCGDFVAIWTVAGRDVARWPFRYAPEE